MLGISADQLATMAKLGVATIRRAEKPGGMQSITEANAAAIRTALESAGVEFIAENGGGAGVRLRKGKPMSKYMLEFKLAGDRDHLFFPLGWWPDLHPALAAANADDQVRQYGPFRFEPTGALTSNWWMIERNERGEEVKRIEVYPVVEQNLR